MRIGFFILFLFTTGIAVSASPSVQPDVSDLPLIEVQPVDPPTDLMGVFLSGDGGWWTLDRVVAETLASHGMPMVGVSSYKYFHTPRNPESVAQDMARIIRHYQSKWKKEHFILVGYSLGAEIMPFVANRLPEDLKNRMSVVALIGPSENTVFEFHYGDWLKLPSSAKTYPVIPEIEQITAPYILCISGKKDTECICSKLNKPTLESIEMEGDHHFGGTYKPIGEAIWAACVAKKDKH